MPSDTQGEHRLLLAVNKDLPPAAPQKMLFDPTVFSHDLVLLDIRKSTFQHLTVNWNFNVLEMALKTFHFVQRLSRTPLFFFPRYLTTRFPKRILQQKRTLKNRKSENLKFQKPCSLTSAQLTHLSLEIPEIHTNTLLVFC